MPKRFIGRRRFNRSIALLIAADVPSDILLDWPSITSLAFSNPAGNSI